MKKRYAITSTVKAAIITVIVIIGVIGTSIAWRLTPIGMDSRINKLENRIEQLERR